MTANELRAAALLELGEVRRSRWVPFATGLYGVLAAVLVGVGMRESSVLGFTGMSRVVLSYVHVLLVVIPLIALTATTQVINRARDDGTIELLFSHPLSREGYFVAVTFTRLVVLVGPLVILLFLMTLVGRVVFGESFEGAMLLRSVAVCTALAWAFVGVGLAISTLTRNQARAVVLGLVAWALAIAVLDLALVPLLLSLRLDARSVFLLAISNPVQAARLALLSGIEPDLGTLGPVGFYLRHSVGPGGLLAIGIGWPFAVGTGSWALALRKFLTGDLV